jgi:hypothetical protein
MNVQDLVVAVFDSLQRRLENNLEKFFQPGPTDQSVCVLHSNRIKKGALWMPRITQSMRQCKIMNLGLTKEGLDFA